MSGGSSIASSSLLVALPSSLVAANDVAVREDSEREMLNAVRPCCSSLPLAILPVGECAGETCTDDTCRAAATAVEVPADGPRRESEGVAAAAAAAGVVRLRL